MSEFRLLGAHMGRNQHAIRLGAVLTEQARQAAYRRVARAAGGEGGAIAAVAHDEHRRHTGVVAVGPTARTR